MISLDVLGQIIGCAEEMVVHVEAIGNSAEPPEVLQTLDDACLDDVASSIDLSLLRAGFAESAEFLVDCLLDFLGSMSRPGGDVYVEHGSEHQRILLGANALCDLFVVHECFVQTAGLAIAEDCGGDIGIRIPGSEERRGDPCDVHAWKLDSVSDDCASFGCNLRRLHVWLCDGLPA